MKSKNKSKNKIISILIPSRNRYKLLKECLYSIFNSVHNIANVEIIVRLDDDDPSLKKYFKKIDLLSHLSVKVIKGERYGYSRVTTYFDEMIPLSKGDIILPFSDDSFIWDHPSCKGWEVDLEKFRGKKLLIRSKSLPMFTRSFYKEMGKFSQLTCAFDTGLPGIAKAKGMYIDYKCIICTQEIHGTD